jgi:hypothetical protein
MANKGNGISISKLKRMIKMINEMKYDIQKQVNEINENMNKQLNGIRKTMQDMKE